MSDKLKRFTDLLKEMFEIDKADLDFGLYRILKLRKNEIENFIDNDLPYKVKEILSSYTKDNLEIKNKMKKIEDSCNELGVSIEELPDTSEKKREYMELKKSLESGTSLTELETDVYSKLYNFFSRYYDEGDFISKRRYKEGIYAIPYEGEEVKLYWANHDQYYIKTSEYFKNYSFISQGIKVNFKLVDVSTEKYNNKEAKDETQSVKMSAYMKNNFPFLGLPKSKLITVIKPYIKTVAKEKVDWNFVDVCWEKDYREAQYTGVEYLFTIQKKLIEQDMDKLRQLIITKSWWDTSDSLDRIVGLLVQKHPILFKTMLDWSKNDNIWLRRVAIDFQLQYKEDVNVDLLEEIICNNFGTGEFFINKAIGWSLRDYSKVNPTWVESFIERHRNKLSKLSIKEASKYL
jgi:3-methyladenine DNA glycosylase AlkD